MDDCYYSWNRSENFDGKLCPKQIIYQKISGQINNKPLYAKLKYNGGYFPYGREGTNYGLLNNYLYFDQRGLHIINFMAFKNTSIPIEIKIDADQELSLIHI